MNKKLHESLLHFQPLALVIILVVILSFSVKNLATRIYYKSLKKGLVVKIIPANEMTSEEQKKISHSFGNASLVLIRTESADYRVVNTASKKPGDTATFSDILNGGVYETEK